MNKYIILILIVSANSLVGAAQDTQPKTRTVKNANWRRLMVKFRNQRNPAAAIANYQSMINFAKSKNKYGMMIYYQLLLGEQYEKTDDYELAETFFSEAYQEAKKHLPKSI